MSDFLALVRQPNPGSESNRRREFCERDSTERPGGDWSQHDVRKELGVCGAVRRAGTLAPCSMAPVYGLQFISIALTRTSPTSMLLVSCFRSSIDAATPLPLLDCVKGPEYLCNKVGRVIVNAPHRESLQSASVCCIKSAAVEKACVESCHWLGQLVGSSISERVTAKLIAQWPRSARFSMSPMPSISGQSAGNQQQP